MSQIQVVDNIDEIRNRKKFESARNWPPFTGVLMVDPKDFRIEYAINPYMIQSNSHVNKVDQQRAVVQWVALAESYKKNGFHVHILHSVAHLPDLVFSANQTFPFWKHSKPHVILSRMAHQERSEEVAYFEDWFSSREYSVHTLKSAGNFEGCGDAILDATRNILWGGYGFRTSPEIYDELALLTGLNIVRLELKREETYHLDTCFSVLTDSSVVIVPDSFDDAGLELIYSFFPTVLTVDIQEARRFAGNCHCPDGSHVFIQKGLPIITEKLKSSGFRVIELETGEFIKAGGSVFCLKQCIF